MAEQKIIFQSEEEYHYILNTCTSIYENIIYAIQFQEEEKV